MAISTTVINFAPIVTTRYAGDLSTAWQTVIDAGGPALLDANPIINPTTQIVRSTTHVFKRNGIGNTLELRMAYSNGISVPTAPQVQVFGRHSSTDWWMSLNNNGATFPSELQITLGTDVDDGTYKYTGNDGANLLWKTLGCEEFIVGIVVPFSGTGTVNTSFIQAKFCNFQT